MNIPKRTFDGQPGPCWYAPTLNRPGHVWNPANTKAILVCPDGHHCSLSSGTHSVAADGVVSPSAVCPVAGCTFHEWIVLDGWPQSAIDNPQSAIP